METCPVFQEDFLQTHSPRGRMEIIRALLIDDELSESKRLKEVVNRCLLCAGCTATCATDIPIDDVIASARYEIFKGKRKNSVERYLMRKIMDQRGITGIMGKVGLMAKKMGLSPKDFPVPARKSFDAMKTGRIMPQGKVRSCVAYYVGCATNTFYPDTGADVVSVLIRNDVEVIIPEGLVCCGIPALVEGDMETVRDMILVNIRILAQLEVDAVVTDCTSCGMMLKTKAINAFAEDDPLHPVIKGVSEKVYEATDYLNQLGLVAQPPSFDNAYTYHVPCHCRWDNTVNHAPRDLLSGVPNARLIEMSEPEICCGAGGAFFMENKELSQNIRSRKLENIKETGARTIVTQCPACRSYMGHPLTDYTVMHPVSFLARAYESG